MLGSLADGLKHGFAVAQGFVIKDAKITAARQRQGGGNRLAPEVGFLRALIQPLRRRPVRSAAAL